MKLKNVHPLEWLLEPLEKHPGYLRKRMFGCEAAYIDGRLMVVLASGEEPWNGLLIATDREFHAALQKRYSNLRPHSVLGKWLYISQKDLSFESIAMSLIESARKQDPLIGVDPKPKKNKSKKQKIQRVKKRN